MRNITGIILAGGKSSRMGQDKGLMKFEGKLMIQHVIDVLIQFVDEIIIITNNQDYKSLGYPIYSDLIKDQGPLAGVYAGLHYSKTDKNLIISCDVPYVNDELIQLIINSSKGFDVVIPRKNEQTHPLIGFYKRSFKTIAKDELSINQRKLKLALCRSNLRIIDANHIDKKVFMNINSL